MMRKREEPREKILDVDASMQGTMTFKDPVNLRINGKFEGKLQTKGSLTIGAEAVVNADINGEEVTVAGRVTGDIRAEKELNLVAPACVVGDVKAPTISITQGAILEGYCNMLDAKPSKKTSEILTADEVAQFLEIDKKVVSEWAESGKLPATKEKSGWRFDKAKIEDWISSERVK
jgi:excisionase family DNA binding protein